MTFFRNILSLILISGGLLSAQSLLAKDIYVIFYATQDGETGHVGIAIDNYQVHLREECEGNENKIYLDSVKIGNLVYYDLWPAKDDIRGMKTFEYVEAEYFRLPAATSEAKITLNSLLKKGIPHKEHKQPDGLLRIRTSAEQDFQLTAFLNGMIEEAKPFHAIKYNCADFVTRALEHVTKKEIHADEWVFFRKTTTPNQLYKDLSGWSSVEILKDPGEKINGNFLSERILHPRRARDIAEF